MESIGYSSSQAKSIDLVITGQLTTTDKTITKSLNGRSSSSRGMHDTVDVGMNEVYKSLTILGDKIIAKLDELLADEVPGGIASLKPENHTSEATAQRIADGATALFAVYARQNPDMEGEELISSFMETIRGGISQGYNEAAAILGDLGAFEFDGVKGGIEETMRLVEEKLLAFEADYREKNGLTQDDAQQPSEQKQVEVSQA